MSTTRTLALAAAAFGILAAAPAAAATSCANIDDAGARALFDKWNAAIGGENPDLALAFYAPNHTFKPHDGEAMTDFTQIRNYWNEFVDEKPQALVDKKDVKIDCNTITKTGVKALKTNDGEVKVNYTMVLENQNGTWLITRHEMTPAG